MYNYNITSNINILWSPRSINICFKNYYTANLLCRFLRKHVTWNHKDNASTSLNWYLFLNLSKSALISPRRSAPAPVLTQEKFKSLLSRNGAMFQLLNLVLLKHFTRSKCLIINNYVDHLSFYVFFSVITYVSKETRTRFCVRMVCPQSI